LLVEREKPEQGERTMTSYTIKNDITGDIFTTEAASGTEAKLNAYTAFIAQDTQADASRLTVVRVVDDGVTEALQEYLGMDVDEAAQMAADLQDGKTGHLSDMRISLRHRNSGE
jgi:hypothetical protein